MTVERNLDESRLGVRSYRGRTLEELLPQIRAELGPDAVIVSERQGFIGGVGGFFAQRFIEVDARPGDGESVNVQLEAFSTDPAPGPTAEPDTALSIPPRLKIRREEPPAPPPAPSVAPPPPTRTFETEILLERLREASAALPANDVGPSVDESLAELATPRRRRTPKPPAAGETPSKRPAASPGWTPPTAPRPARSVAGPPASWEARVDAATPAGPPPRAPQAFRLRPQARPLAGATRPAIADANPYESVRRPPAAAAAAESTRPAWRPATRVRPERPDRPGIGPRKYTAPPPPRLVMEPTSTRRGSRNVFRAALERVLKREQPTVMRLPPPPQPLDTFAATAVARVLWARGASQAWTDELIRTAGAHGKPMTGSLRAAAEGEVARRIVLAPPLPATGAAIAFVGAPGSGKTSCTASIASAYRRASTLTVTVVALDNPLGARELRTLLDDDGVPVHSVSAEEAEQAIAAGRKGGLVIVDTSATTPTDPAAVQALGAKLEPLGLDAIYVTLPATLGPAAARQTLASFGRLAPTAVTITHADETNQLAVSIEIAIAYRIPLAYFHSGTDHTNALSTADPVAIAQELLPWPAR